MLTPDQASTLIDYLEMMEARTNHQRNMQFMTEELQTSEQELHEACRALGDIAGRDYGIL